MTLAPINKPEIADQTNGGGTVCTQQTPVNLQVITQHMKKLTRKKLLAIKKQLMADRMPAKQVKAIGKHMLYLVNLYGIDKKRLLKSIEKTLAASKSQRK